jgi:hypothetical protein
MKYSIGKNLTAGVSNTILTVPTGYHAEVTMLFISNIGGSSKGVTSAWHGDSTITFLGGKSVSAADYVQFGGPLGSFLIMKDGDYMTITPDSGSTFTCIMSFLLYPHQATNFTF